MQGQNGVGVSPCSAWCQCCHPLPAYAARCAAGESARASYRCHCQALGLWPVAQLTDEHSHQHCRQAWRSAWCVRTARGREGHQNRPSEHNERCELYANTFAGGFCTHLANEASRGQCDHEIVRRVALVVATSSASQASRGPPSYSEPPAPAAAGGHRRRGRRRRDRRRGRRRFARARLSGWSWPNSADWRHLQVVQAHYDQEGCQQPLDKHEEHIGEGMNKIGIVFTYALWC
jgi:hypothetical protein